MRQLLNDLFDLRNINLRIVKKEKNLIEQANKSCILFIFLNRKFKTLNSAQQNQKKERFKSRVSLVHWASVDLRYV